MGESAAYAGNQQAPHGVLEDAAVFGAQDVLNVLLVGFPPFAE